MKLRLLILLILGALLIPGCDNSSSNIEFSGLPGEFIYKKGLSKKEAKELKTILEEKDNDCPEYSLEKYMEPLWESKVVYNESIYPIENEDGSISPIPLMYEPVAILSVRDSSLKKQYVKGVDYDLKDGKIVILKSGSIPRVKYKDYWLDHALEGASFPRTGGGFILYGQGEPFLSKQLAVTYVHLDKWKGELPKGKSNLLPKTVQKLENKEELKIVFYGDSISEGCNSSGFHNVEPFAEDWCSMVTSFLKEKYDHPSITMVNASLGGADSNWGYSAVRSAANHKPDLVVIAFGMNDGTARVPTATYKRNVTKMMEKIKGANENCEFILVGTMLANEDVAGFVGLQEEYLPELLSLEEEGVAVADMTTVHKYLLTRKRYYDMTGNNVNHPNDFLARFYAQVVAQTITSYKPY